MVSTHLRARVAICLPLLWITWVAGQGPSPGNDPITPQAVAQFTMDTIINNMGDNVPLQPLTDRAGLSGTLNQLKQILPSGPLVLTTPRDISILESGSISYLSCEPSDWNSQIGPREALQLAAGKEPNAIVLYSRDAAHCSYTPMDGLTNVSIYTMLDTVLSSHIFNGLQNGNPPNPPTSIRVNQTTFNNTDTTSSNVLGRSPTTAVAMIILYSITGIITALFLIIIVVGAIRAHRHPERYGPRHVVGRPRQSRAKGIARAMLETLPIVKFGDKEEDMKPSEAGRDVELGTANAEHREDIAHGSGQPDGGGEASSTSKVVPASVPDVVTTEAAAGSTHTHEERQDPANPVDSGLACSVCTDDFIKGQDTRVLPCKHKFHPECIDPWLLNVSGTCPLCRIDLHPATSHGAFEGRGDGPSLEIRAYSEQPTSTEAIANETNRRNPRSRILSILNIGRMRHATPEERIEALRTLRSEGMTGIERQEQGGQAGVDRAINRLSRRFGRALGSRPVSAMTSSRPVSDVPPATTELEQAPTSRETEAHSDSDQRRRESSVT
ncbi:MAG: hypothetical protein Q9163_004193 [Psora crenata]